MMDLHSDSRVYLVVKNHEDQHSIWPVGKELPLGWVDAGMRGRRDECLSFIARCWIDIRPVSARIPACQE